MAGEYLLGPMILATAAWIGCGETGPSRPISAGSSTQGNLTIGANSLDFGSISVGSRKTNSLVLNNGVSGGSSITVTQTSVTGTGFSLSSGPAVPFVLAFAVVLSRYENQIEWKNSKKAITGRKRAGIQPGI